MEPARRLVGPARALGALTKVGTVVAAVAGGLLWLELFVRPLLRGPGWPLAIGALVALGVLALPAWWLRHATEAFADLAVLPDRLDTLQRQGRPDLTIGSRADLRQLRHGGIVNAARTIFTTVRELADFLSPATTAIEVAAPTFWVATAIAAAAAVLLAVLALTVGPLVLLLA